MVSPTFWQNKKVLVTGHTGFKGSWLVLYLHRLGAKVMGVALEPTTLPNMFSACQIEQKIQSQFLDIRNLEGLQKTFAAFQPEIVFHLAAQALVGASYENPIETYSTNVLGTAHVLECCRLTTSVRVIVNVTSDKCYENKENSLPHKEGDILGGHDPYSSSKACAELVSAAYQKSFFQQKTGLASVRAGNIFGGGDWTRTRLIPDFVRSVHENSPLVLRHPEAIRPWQHVLEPVYGYLMLAEKLWASPKEFSSAFNFGPEEASCVSVARVINKLIQIWGKGSFTKQNTQYHETQVLRLDSQKAKSMLGWKPHWSLDQALEMSALWYQSFYRNEDVYNTSIKQIETYEKQIQ